MLFALFLGCAVWRSVAVESVTRPLPDGAVVGQPGQWTRCRAEYESVGSLVMDIETEGRYDGLVDVWVDQRWLYPVPTPNGCVQVTARPWRAK